MYEEGWGYVQGKRGWCRWVKIREVIGRANEENTGEGIDLGSRERCRETERVKGKAKGLRLTERG